MNEAREERLVEQLVTYTLEVDGEVIIVEHVPAHVNEETGERLFAPRRWRDSRRSFGRGGSPAA